MTHRSIHVGQTTVGIRLSHRVHDGTGCVLANKLTADGKTRVLMLEVGLGMSTV